MTIARENGPILEGLRTSWSGVRISPGPPSQALKITPKNLNFYSAVLGRQFHSQPPTTPLFELGYLWEICELGDLPFPLTEPLIF